MLETPYTAMVPKLHVTQFQEHKTFPDTKFSELNCPRDETSSQHQEIQRCSNHDLLVTSSDR